MKRFCLIIVLFLFACSCTFRTSKNHHVEEFQVDNLLNDIQFINYDSLRDSLINFMSQGRKYHNDEGKTIYTIEFSKYKQDTLISFWAFYDILDFDFPFYDSRFILETDKNMNLLQQSDWMKLYESIVGKISDNTLYGAVEINDSSVLSITMREGIEMMDVINTSKFDTTTFNHYKVHIRGDDDRMPVIKIYQYNKKGGLRLRYSR